MRNGISHNDTKRHHASERKRPLRETNRNKPGAAETMCNGGLKGVRATHLGVEDNEADGPVDSQGEEAEEEDTGDKTGLREGVGLADDSRANDAVGHVAEGAEERAAGAVAGVVI